MKPEEIKAVLVEYHQSLMKILKAMADAPNTQPGEKNQATTSAGVDFARVVGDFDAKYGQALKS